MVKLNIKKVDAVIQARYGSSRLPGKILYKINNKSLLDILIIRLKKSKYINRIANKKRYCQWHNKQD